MSDWNAKLRQLGDVYMDMQNHLGDLAAQQADAVASLEQFKETARQERAAMLKLYKEETNKQEKLLGDKIKALEDEKATLSQIVYDVPKYVTLNVGGRIYKTTQDTLCLQDTMLSAMFSGRHDLSKDLDENGHYFLDRDGDNFKYILAWLRCRHDVPELETMEVGQLRSLQIEANFFQVDSLSHKIFKILKEREKGPHCSYALLEVNFEANSLVKGMIASAYWRDTIPEPTLLRLDSTPSRKNNTFFPVSGQQPTKFKSLTQIFGELDALGWELVTSEQISVRNSNVYHFRKALGRQ